MRPNVHHKAILNHLKKMVLKKELLFTNGQGVFLHRRTSDGGLFVVGTHLPYMPSDPLAFFSKDSIRKDYNYAHIEREAGMLKFTWANSEYTFGEKNLITMEALPVSVNNACGVGMLPAYVTEWQKERMEEAVADFGMLADFPMQYSKAIKENELSSEERRLMSYNLEALEKINGKPTVCDYEEFRRTIVCRTVYLNGLEATSYVCAE